MNYMNLKFGLTRLACLALALVTLACNDDKKKVLPGGNAEGMRTRTFFSSQLSEGWKYFSFKKGAFVTLTEEQSKSSLDWDVAFNRYYVRTNSGTSGQGKAGCLDSGEKDFNAVVVDKHAAFIQDDMTAIMGTMGKDTVVSCNPAPECEGSHSWAWYKYMEGQWYYNHHVFVVRSASGENCAKLIFDTYKDAAGNSGHITFRYVYDGEQDADAVQPDEPETPVGPTPAEAKRDTVKSGFMSGSKWHYYSFKNGELTDMTDEKAGKSADWDIAFDRNYIRTNSAAFGGGKGGALDMNKASFDEVPNCPTSGYTVDKIATIANSPMSSPETLEASINPAFKCGETEGAWFLSKGMGGGFDYNNHVFAVLCADGKTRAKLIMHSFGNSNIVFEFVYPAK